MLTQTMIRSSGISCAFWRIEQESLHEAFLRDVLSRVPTASTSQASAPTFAERPAADRSSGREQELEQAGDASFREQEEAAAIAAALVASALRRTDGKQAKKKKREGSKDSKGRDGKKTKLVRADSDDADELGRDAAVVRDGGALDTSVHTSVTEATHASSQCGVGQLVRCMLNIFISRSLALSLCLSRARALSRYLYLSIYL